MTLLAASLTFQTAFAVPTPRDSSSLLYVYDALCGWCHGFSAALETFSEAHPELPVRVVSGGMILGEREGPIGEVAAYIKRAYRDVERATGVAFGAGFVDGHHERGDMLMSSLPPAALLAWARERAPERQREAAKIIQEGIYGLGYGPTTPALARHLAAGLGLDGEEAVAALGNPTYRRQAEADFALAQRLGVRGFPALFLVDAAGGARLLASGYRTAAQLKSALAEASAARR